MQTDVRVDKVEYACAACGQVNRFPRARAADDPTCGRCGQKVFPRAPVDGSDASFAREVEGCPIPVLVDFWAPWCGPCRAVAPALAQIARERGGRLKVVKVNVDENPRVASRFGIRSIPTMMVFANGRVIDQLQGALPKPQLDARLDRFIR